ncbi:hypothetical protein BZA77DRAFT_67254 [Pyronema omphalodes]|nr:hypothetical protein BZA77DRAFT_67254 [Pyronema omphalodes]
MVHDEVMADDRPPTNDAKIRYCVVVVVVVLLLWLSNQLLHCVVAIQPQLPCHIVIVAIQPSLSYHVVAIQPNLSYVPMYCIILLWPFVHPIIFSLCHILR